jgi:dTDP-glucose pyrophosphorylase
MQVMILCGGLGTRLREETEYRPKPMVDIGGRPDELEPAVYTTIGWTRKK